MAKGQIKGNREAKKPKSTTKGKSPAAEKSLFPADGGKSKPGSSSGKKSR